MPLVSVIIPVYNDHERLRSCVDGLVRQTYPHDQFEVIVVDNGSMPPIAGWLAGLPVKVLVENAVRSSYAARNHGLRHAQGDVIALLDADCLPETNWIEAGVRALQNARADLVGGRVAFTFGERRTGAEIFDALTNMQVAENVRSRGVAKTANLFLRRDVVTRIGPFPAHLQSGGDVVWTRAATRQGLRLVYGSDVVVYHPARRLGALLRKQYRVGAGQRAIWRDERRPIGKAARSVVVGFLPPFPGAFRRMLRRASPPVRGWETARVWFAGWAARVATSLGRIAGYLTRRTSAP